MALLLDTLLYQLFGITLIRKKNNSIRLFALVLLSLFLVHCAKKSPSLDNLDLNSWKNDRDGCKGDRTAMYEVLVHQKKKLLALQETQLIRLLGRPDKSELLPRNQKFYYYYLTPGPNCASSHTHLKILKIRFNAVGLSKEISIQ